MNTVPKRVELTDMKQRTQIRVYYSISWDFPSGASVKEPICQCRRGDIKDTGSVSGSGSSSRERNGNPLQYFC